MKAKPTSSNLTDIDSDSFTVQLDDESLSSSHIEAGESGLTPIHRQNIDEQRRIALAKSTIRLLVISLTLMPQMKVIKTDFMY